MRQTRLFDLLLFDLDGVVTTERIYWDCARLTVWELFQVHLRNAGPYTPAVHDGTARDGVIPEDLIYAIKNRSINSNWDLTFLVTCGHLRAMPVGAGRGAESLNELVATLYARPAEIGDWRVPVSALLDGAADLSGAELLGWAGTQAARHLGAAEALLMPEGSLWQMLYARFQGWYNGRLMGVWGAQRLPEQAVIPVDMLKQVFAALKIGGYTLGIVTGRPRVEAAYALEMFGIWEEFSLRHTVTFDAVEAAQALLGESGLGKPHPYSIRKALCPDAASEALVREDCRAEARALMIGDSTSDALAAVRAGIPCLGVTSGVVGQTARAQRQEALLAAGCVAVLEDIRALPEWLARHAYEASV